MEDITESRKMVEDMLHKNGEQKEIERRYEEQGVFFLLFSKEIIRYVFERYCVDLMVLFFEKKINKNSLF